MATLITRANLLASWASATNVVLARTYVLLISGLLVWSSAPALLGWQSTVILTGSMSPALVPGDVVAVQPVDPSRVRAGQVVLVSDPDDRGRTLVHRVEERRPDGSLVLRGDANRSVDAHAARPSEVRGLARVNIPAIGLPRVWLREQRYAELLAAAVLTAAALAVTASDARTARAHAPAAAAQEPTPARRPSPPRGHGPAEPAVACRTIVPAQRRPRLLVAP